MQTGLALVSILAATVFFISWAIVPWYDRRHRNKESKPVNAPPPTAEQQNAMYNAKAQAMFIAYHKTVSGESWGIISYFSEWCNVKQDIKDGWIAAAKTIPWQSL